MVTSFNFFRVITPFLLLVMSGRTPLIFCTPKPQLEEPHLKEGDLIPLFANNVIPCVHCRKNFPYGLPFCPTGDPMPNRKRSTEEIISGDCFIKTQYELKFKVGTVGKILCEKTLTKNEVKQIRQAVSEKSQYQMNFNKILFPTNVGFVKPMGVIVFPMYGYYLVKHIDFYPQYYEDQVVDIKSIGDLYSAVDITEDAEIRVYFTYSVFWKDSNIKPTKSITQNGPATKTDWWNLEKKGVNIKFTRLIFWVLSLFLSLSLLAVPISVYLIRGISFRFRFGQESTKEGFRVPTYRSLLGAILGIGTQHLIMIIFILIFGFHDIFYWLDLGSRTTVLVGYSLLFSYYGYEVASLQGKQFLQRKHGWSHWVGQIDIQKFIRMMLISFVGVHATAKVAFGSNDHFITATFIAVTGVATLFSWSGGGIFAYYVKYRPLNRNAAKRFKRKIPWWQSKLMRTPAQMFFGGLLPFLAIFRNLDEINASLLSLKVCGVFSTMFLSFVTVSTVTTVLGAVFTGFQLYKRDFNWWWRSVLRGGSTAIFVFAYGIYFHFKVNEEIFANLYIFLVYNFCLCYVFFVVLGAISFYASAIAFYIIRICSRLD